MNFLRSGGSIVFEILGEFLNNIRDFIVNIGGTLTDIAAELGPWFAPLAPAMFSYTHLTLFMGFSKAAAFAVAASIEFVGLASTGTLLTIMLEKIPPV